MSKLPNLLEHPLSAAANGHSLLGEIITWSVSGAGIRYADLTRALREADLRESVAGELAPRHAFARACHKLSEDRIIRQVSEDEETISFQFTAERLKGDRFEYDFETLLRLNKSSGSIECTLRELAALAQEELDRCQEARTASDVTRIVQRLFEQQADLFPIREQGGAYFVPQQHVPFVDQVQRFLTALNGRIHRFPIPSGTPHGDRSVKDAVADGISAMITEHEVAIDRFDGDTRPSTLKRAAERIQVTKHKIEAYACYLSEERARLQRSLAAATHKLRSKVEALAAEADVPPSEPLFESNGAAGARSGILEPAGA